MISAESTTRYEAKHTSAAQSPLTQPGKAIEERFLTGKYDEQNFQLIVYSSSKPSWSVKSQVK